MKTFNALFIAAFLIVGAASAIAQDQLAINQEPIQKDLDPNAVIVAHPNVACDGDSVNNVIEVLDYPYYNIVATVAISNVGENDFLLCNGTIQTLTGGAIAVRVEVRDNNNGIFLADPEPTDSWPIIAPANGGLNFGSGTWWIRPSERPGFELGTVTLSLHANEALGTGAVMGFRSFCCQKFSNTVSSQTKTVVVPLFD